MGKQQLALSFMITSDMLNVRKIIKLVAVRLQYSRFMNEKDRFKPKTEGARDYLTIILDKATNDIESQFKLRSKTFLRFFRSED